MRAAILFLVALSIVHLGECIKFDYKLGPKSMVCFGESLMDHTLVVGEVANKDNNVMVRVYDPIGQLIFTQKNDTIIKFSFTGHVNGTHQICMDNLHTEEVIFNFVLLVGLEAKDFSVLANKNKLKPMDVQMLRIEELYKVIHQTQEHLVLNSEIKLKAADFINNKIFYSSLITLFLVIVLTFFQSYYVKDFFKQKKLI